MSDTDTRKEAVADKVTLMRNKAFKEVGGFLQTDYDIAENADLIEALSRDLEVMRAERDAALECVAIEATARGMAEARVAELEGAIQAFVDFDNLPSQHKRPDVFELRVRQPILRAAIAREPKP